MCFIKYCSARLVPDPISTKADRFTKHCVDCLPSLCQCLTLILSSGVLVQCLAHLFSMFVLTVQVHDVLSVENVVTTFTSSRKCKSMKNLSQSAQI